MEKFKNGEKVGHGAKILRSKNVVIVKLEIHITQWSRTH